MTGGIVKGNCNVCREGNNWLSTKRKMHRPCNNSNTKTTELLNTRFAIFLKLLKILTYSV